MSGSEPGGVSNRPSKEHFGEAVERAKSAQGFDEQIAAIIKQRLRAGAASDDEIVAAVRRRVNPRLIEVLHGYLS